MKKCFCCLRTIKDDAYSPVSAVKGRAKPFRWWFARKYAAKNAREPYHLKCAEQIASLRNRQESEGNAARFNSFPLV